MIGNMLQTRFNACIRLTGFPELHKNPPVTLRALPPGGSEQGDKGEILGLGARGLREEEGFKPSPCQEKSKEQAREAKRERTSHVGQQRWDIDNSRTPEGGVGLAGG